MVEMNRPGRAKPVWVEDGAPREAGLASEVRGGGNRGKATEGKADEQR